MALGRRQPTEQSFWVTTASLPRSPGHPFYERLNGLLSDMDFDRKVEALWAPFYAENGRDSIPPGVVYRMLFVGYFEGITSQRGIAWRCSDSLSLRAFLGLGIEGKVPDHSSLTKIRQRIPAKIDQQVFQLVLEEAAKRGLLKGKTVAVDATMLEANAAMKAIVLRETGEDWNEFLTRLYREERGDDDDDDSDPPSANELRRFDKQRGKKGKKKVSNDTWKSPSDPDSRIAKLKDGRTHLAYKAEHVVDLDTELILAARVLHATEADSATFLGSVEAAQANLEAANCDVEIREAVADKGYHKAEVLAEARAAGLRTYVPEPRVQGGKRRWAKKPPEWKDAVYANRRRVRGERSKRLQRQRSERVERSFAHTCETGGGRRAWLRGLENVDRRHLTQALARNLSLIVRHLFGVGTPRGLQGGEGLVAAGIALLLSVLAAMRRVFGEGLVAFATANEAPASGTRYHATWPTTAGGHSNMVSRACFSTGC